MRTSLAHPDYAAFLVALKVREAMTDKPRNTQKPHRKETP